MPKSRTTLIMLGCLSLLLLGLIAPLAAQDNAVTITLTVPDFMEDVITEEMLADFEAQNPGIKVQVVDGAFGLTPPTDNVDAHLSEMAEYAASADVLYTSSNTLTREATTAGYLLDLSPLTNADSTLNADDFIPQAWQSVQWDRGVWALPVSVNVLLMVYNPAAFDRASIPYPNESWTLADFADAARRLTETQDDGTVKTGYFDFGNGDFLFRSLLGTSLYDPTTAPAQPDLDNPAVAELLNTLTELNAEGVIGSVGSGISVIAIGGGAEDGPAMSVQQSFALASFGGFGNNNNAQPVAGALLPGGVAGINVESFSISAGTLYPEQAYTLLKFLTSNADIASNIFGGTPARRSLAGMESSNTNGPGGGGRGGFNIQLSPENQAIVDEALSRAVSVTDMSFYEYLDIALEKMQTDGIDAATALQEVELQAITNLDTALAARGTTQINVATPVPEVILAPGEVALKFGISSFVSPLPNQTEWNQLISDFVANDAEVGQIILDSDFNNNLSDMATSFDCFYMPTNAVTDGDLTTIISLDPFMDVDPNFDKSDVIGNTLSQLQFENRTWAFPVTLQPNILRYNADLFAQAGVVAPVNGWTIDSFVDALRNLQAMDDTSAPFQPGGGNEYLLALIAAYGGLPIDYRTDPPTFSFSDPLNADAVRQTLDLAKNGLIEYQAVGGGGGGRIFALAGIGADADADENPMAVSTYSLNGLNDFIVRRGGPGQNAENQNADDGYQLTTYPTGTQYAPVSYDIGTAYISANAENPDACYRWISEVSRQPSLFSTMPARRSLINDPSLTASEDPDTIVFYNQFAALLSQGNAINFPAGFGGGPINNMVTRWLNRAFDRYVNEDADLDAELLEAQTFTQEFMACTSGLPPIDNAASQADRREAFQAYNECASAVDPTINS